MRLRFWGAMHGAMEAIPAGVLARSRRLRRLRNWVLYRFVFAAADDMRRLGQRQS